MKKAVFALQIFGLIALLPAYLILELDVKTVESQGHKTNLLIRNNSALPDSREFENQGAEDRIQLFDVNPKAAF